MTPVEQYSTTHKYGYNRFMKTTVEISDSLYRQAKRHAADHGITFREIVESGVRVVVEHKRPKKPFRLRKAPFEGDGLLPGLTWDEIRDRSYEGRGA